MNSMIETTEWYTSSLGCVGIVLVNTGFGHKAYIGVGAGHNEHADAQTIASMGARFQQGPALWPHIKEWAE